MPKSILTVSHPYLNKDGVFSSHYVVEKAVNTMANSLHLMIIFLIQAVTESLSLTCFHIFGHSVGAAYSLGFTEFSQYHRRIILGDYPAYYPQFSSQWAERICTYSSQHMTCSTARKIAEQSTHINLFPLLKQALMPPVLLYSTQSDSLIKQHHIDMFLQYREDTLCYPVHSVGHALFSLSSSECIDRISSLLSNDDRKIIKQDNK